MTIAATVQPTSQALLSSFNEISVKHLLPLMIILNTHTQWSQHAVNDLNPNNIPPLRAVAASYLLAQL